VDEAGAPFTPIGQNDAIEWPELAGLFRRRDFGSVRNYFTLLRASGVTVLRLMLEYCHHERRYFERPAGQFAPGMVRLWDDLFALCQEFGLRLLLTPFDSFWMWRRWGKHPYNSANGGPCTRRNRFFLCPATRELVKRRFDFVTERWGSTGAIFAWDLWNELHPAYGQDSVECARDFVTGISEHLRDTEKRRHGRAHLQTVSVFLPLAQEKPELAEVIYRHPLLDFATTHFYEEGTIDHPKDTVQPAISTGKLVREALEHAPPMRPFFDSEHGPIHTFKDHHRTLPEAFDDEYFRHMQWAHFASGGAGGAMRWPNRNPHVLTPGMREAQKRLAAFLPLIEWNTFRRCNWNQEVRIAGGAECVAFACGDGSQAIVWLLRTGTIRKNGMLDREAKPMEVEIAVPWNGGSVLKTPPFVTDVALALRRSPDGSDILQTPFETL
jgi:mannan endo-1,4-beta-mannosidase